MTNFNFPFYVKRDSEEITFDDVFTRHFKLLLMERVWRHIDFHFEKNELFVKDEFQKVNSVDLYEVAKAMYDEAYLYNEMFTRRGITHDYHNYF